MFAMEMPPLGLGTYKLLGDQCTKIVARALELGYRHIDTALVYENHLQIAPAIRDFPRDQLFITSKILPVDCTKERLGPATERILNELEIDYLDLLLVHAPDRSIPYEETYPALYEQQKKGLTRTIGVSNCTTRHIDDLLALDIPIVNNQVEFHPYLYQKELLEHCKAHNISVTAYCPIARGRLRDDSTLMAIGKIYGKTPEQVSMRWLLQHDLVVIPKTSQFNRLEENMALFDFELTPDQMHQIDQLDRGERCVDGPWCDFLYI